MRVSSTFTACDGKDADLLPDELKTVALTMVAAGLDTLPGNINMTIAYLSSAHGQEVQERAYHEIMEAYKGENPWEMSLVDERCEFMQSFVKVWLLLVSDVSMGRLANIARVIGDSAILVHTQHVFHPAKHQANTLQRRRDPDRYALFHGMYGSMPAPRRARSLTMSKNMWAANHDPTHFKSPLEFVPERFVGIPEAGTQHFAYGAGSRICAGNQLANRQLYVIFTRLILAFHVKPTTVVSMRPELDTIECNSVPTSMVTQPKPFQVYLEPRSNTQLQGWLADSRARTADVK